MISSKFVPEWQSLFIKTLHKVLSSDFSLNWMSTANMNLRREWILKKIPRKIFAANHFSNCRGLLHTFYRFIVCIKKNVQILYHIEKENIYSIHTQNWWISMEKIAGRRGMVYQPKTQTNLRTINQKSKTEIPSNSNGKNSKWSVVWGSSQVTDSVIMNNHNTFFGSVNVD